MLLSSLQCQMAVRSWTPFALRICSPDKGDGIDAQMAGLQYLQIAFFRQLLKLKRSIFPDVILLSWQRPCGSARTWWSQVLSFMHRLDSMDEGNLHP